MPYRIDPKDNRTVQVRRRNRWVTKHSFKTAKEALAYLRALYANVKDAGRR